MLVYMSPSDIRFMHGRISPRFKNGNGVNATVDLIAKGRMDVYGLPKIRVVARNGRYYAFDNRRLYVYRALQHKGVLDRIIVDLVSNRLFQPRRFTTKNDGTSINFSGCLAIPYRHEPVSKDEPGIDSLSEALLNCSIEQDSSSHETALRPFFI